MKIMKSVFALWIGLAVLAVAGCGPEQTSGQSGTPAKQLPPEAIRALSESAAMAQITPEQMAEAASTRRIAREYFDKSLAVANASGKKLFVHFSADWCAWCPKLKKYLDQNMALFEDELVFVNIKTDKMEGGDQMLQDFQKGRDAGLPWMVIVDSDGTEIISSVDSEGKNCRCPVETHEIAHFGKMIQTSTGCDDEQLAQIVESLKKYADSLK